jgi:tetratricopeptide (TPR) repeat protein
VTTKIFQSFAFIVASLLAFNNPCWAGDPFRNNNSRQIGEKTESAFNRLFQKGNYQEAKNLAIAATEQETKEPLAYAMRASLAYTEGDWEGLKSYGDLTVKAAEGLQESDPLRSKLYLGVGYFLQGSYLYQKEGVLSAIAKLQEVLKYMDEAAKQDPQDPELNLIKGYMDLFLSVNLPFASAEQAIERLEKYAGPEYLVNRGIAVAYRDLKQYDKALQFVNVAISQTPDNPELYYLKGQILRKQGKKNSDLGKFKQALENFDRALSQSAQLPKSIVKTLKRERDETQTKIQQMS